MEFFQEKLEQIESLIQKNNLPAAIAEYHQLYNKVSPEDHILIHVITRDLGFLYYETENYAEAIDLLSTALSHNFDDENGKINRILGFSYIKTGKIAFAIEFLEESLYHNLEKTKTYFITKYELGKAYLEINEAKSAKTQLKEAIDFFENNALTSYFASSAYYLGFAYYQLEEFDLADEFFELLLKNKDISKDQKAHGYYGKLFLAKSEKDADKMIHFAGKLMELIPNFYDKETIMYFIVLAYNYQKRHQEAEKALEILIKEFPHGKYSDQYDELINNNE
jgi:tetratricopeptide (TPR) repeat protein